jgi:hypothetical protein
VSNDPAIPLGRQMKPSDEYKVNRRRVLAAAEDEPFVCWTRAAKVIIVEDSQPDYSQYDCDMDRCGRITPCCNREKVIVGAVDAVGGPEFNTDSVHVIGTTTQAESRRRVTDPTSESYVSAMKPTLDDVLYAFSRGMDVAKMPLDGDSSDGNHTFNELYEMRAALFCALTAVIEKSNYTARQYSNDATRFHCWKSKLHSDGSIPFDDPTMFICGITATGGLPMQITFHYSIDPWWDRLDSCAIWERADIYDGHTSADVIERLQDMF